jgi:hypothetical protein
MRVLMLYALALTALVLVLGGCSSTYWSRPDAKLDALAHESGACYKAAVEAVEGESPSALPAATASGSTSARLLPPTEPPPKLWARSPRESGFARFDEQMRYERCMQQRGWSRTRS